MQVIRRRRWTNHCWHISTQERLTLMALASIHHKRIRNRSKSWSITGARLIWQRSNSNGTEVWIGRNFWTSTHPGPFTSIPSPQIIQISINSIFIGTVSWQHLAWQIQFLLFFLFLYFSLSFSIALIPCFQCKIIIYYHTCDTNIFLSISLPLSVCLCACFLCIRLHPSWRLLLATPCRSTSKQPKTACTINKCDGTVPCSWNWMLRGLSESSVVACQE